MTPTISIPGYRINEYLLVLDPPQDLWQKIMKIKEGFAEKYKNEIDSESAASRTNKRRC